MTSLKRGDRVRLPLVVGEVVDFVDFTEGERAWVKWDDGDETTEFVQDLVLVARDRRQSVSTNWTKAMGNALGWFCPAGLEWAEQFEDPNEAWHACQRPEWMVFYIYHLWGTLSDDSHRTIAGGYASSLAEWLELGEGSWALTKGTPAQADLLRELWPDLPLVV